MTLGTSTYAVCASQRSWYAAHATCLALGMDLLTLETLEEEDAVVTAAAGIGVSTLWLGYNDLAADGAHAWTQGGSDYANWCSGQPSVSQTFDCSALGSCDGTGWSVRQCDTPAAFVCENPCDDHDPCTKDAVVASACQHVAVVCDDGDPCTEETCDPTGGCEATPSAATCDDHDACTDDACESTRLCAQVGEQLAKVATLSCPSGVIANVAFATYGKPLGSCGSYEVGACAADVTAYVEGKCLGLSDCTIDLSESGGGDPCPGIFKVLAVEVYCSACTHAGPGDAGACPACDQGYIPVDGLCLPE